MKNPSLLLTLEYPPQRGGVATYLAGEVASAAEPVQVVLAQTYFWNKWPVWLPLLWCGDRPDYLWISHILPIGYVALVWKKIFGIKYRVYLHGLDLVLPRRSVWKGFWARQILLAADEIVVNSQATAKLLDYYNIPPARARVSPPKIKEVNTLNYQARGKALREKYGLVDKPVLLTVSRLVKRKGVNLVIRALSAVWQTIPDLVYVVVGSGEEYNHLRVIASTLAGINSAKQSRDQRNVQEKHDGIAASLANTLAPRNDSGVIFTGAVTEEEKYAWLAACDCFILTPVDDPNDFEGYGIVYKEAQMFGKPVIGSRVGGVPEAIGDNGILVDAGKIQQITEAIITILNAKFQSSNAK